MIDIRVLNKMFDFARHIPKVMNEAEYQVLLSQERIYTTSARLYDWQASELIDPKLEYRELATYEGKIIAASWEEARSIAEARGWGEIVDGILIETIPWESAPIMQFNSN